jgi:hypothetical protein
MADWAAKIRSWPWGRDYGMAAIGNFAEPKAIWDKPERLRRFAGTGWWARQGSNL